MLRALATLDCEITAITSVTDDGGCSGRLRSEFSMPPPGDLRRCLSTLATDRALASQFETRVDVGGVQRSAGNLALLEAYSRTGSLQAAADWAASLLRCVGRVTPASETPGRLAIYDRAKGVLVGESTIAEASEAPMVVAVHDAEAANPVATQAIAEADVIIIGPGSFVTSTLATLMTGDIATAVASSSARRLFMANLVPEGGQTRNFEPKDFARLVRDHLCIASGYAAVPFEIVRHGHTHGLQDGDHELSLAEEEAPHRHDPDRVATAIGRLCDIPRRRTPSDVPPPSVTGRAFEAYVERAKNRLSTVAVD